MNKKGKYKTYSYEKLINIYWLKQINPLLNELYVCVFTHIS